MEDNNLITDGLKIYTFDDFRAALEKKFPQGITLKMDKFSQEQLHSYYLLNSFDGNYDQRLTVTDGNVAWESDTKQLHAEVRLKPEDYKHIEVNWYDFCDDEIIKEFTDKAINEEDWPYTYFMNRYPDLTNIPVTVYNQVVAHNLWVEGLHLHDALNLAIQKRETDLSPAKTKTMLQLMAVYTRGAKFFDDGGVLTRSAANSVSAAAEWNKMFSDNIGQASQGSTMTEQDKRQIFDSNVKLQAKIALQYEGLLKTTPQTYLVTVIPQADRMPSRRQQPTDIEMIDAQVKKFNDWYLEEGLFDKAAYAIRPDGCDQVWVNINTTDPLRQYVVHNHMQAMANGGQIVQTDYQNLYKFRQDVPDNVMQKMDDKVRKVAEAARYSRQLMCYVNNGGAYFYQRGTLGYAHIAIDRALRVNGEPLSPDNSKKILSLALDGNIIGHQGTEHRALFCPPLNPVEKLMMNKADSSVKYLTEQHSYDGKKHLVDYKRVVDADQYTDIGQRIGKVNLYGSGDRIFLRAEIDGQMQPGKLLDKADRIKVSFYQGLSVEDKAWQRFTRMLAGKTYHAELELTPQQKDLEQNNKNGFKR